MRRTTARRQWRYLCSLLVVFPVEILVVGLLVETQMLEFWRICLGSPLKRIGFVTRQPCCYDYGQTWVCWAQWPGQCPPGEWTGHFRFFQCGTCGNSGFNPSFVCHQVCGQEVGPGCRLTAGPGGSGGECGFRIAKVECTDPRKEWREANFHTSDDKNDYIVSVGRVATDLEADALLQEMRNTYSGIELRPPVPKRPSRRWMRSRMANGAGSSPPSSPRGVGPGTR